MMEFTLKEFLAWCDEIENDVALTADGHDNAITGAGEISGSLVVIYDMDLVIKNLMDMGMDREDAIEFYQYNIAGSCGNGMPVFQDIKIVPG